MNQAKHKNINEAIKLGTNFLTKSQRKDGSLPSFISASRRFDNPEEKQSVFPTCLILSSLSGLDHSTDIKKIKDKAVKFLLNQKSEFWSWNYWRRNSRESKSTPYPDDLDDTCCALVALISTDSKNVPVKAIAKAVNLLAYCESKEGGPYYTWITPPDADKSWKDIDLAVNSNVAFFLSLQGVALPNLVALAERAIKSEKYDSVYYHSPYPVIYFISRWYRGKMKDKIIAYLLKKRLKNNSWGDPLKTALAVNALINLGYEKERLAESVGYILENQVGGKWKASPLIIELQKKKQTYYSGSAELTTAFCLEALGKFSERSESMKGGRKAGMDDEAKRVHKKIIEIVDRTFSRFDPEMVNDFSNVKKKILKGDGVNAITLLPYYFRKSLGKKSIDETIAIKLGAAGFYGWMAYTIYDDFFDDEGDPKVLSLANVCLRELVSIYDSEFSNDENFLKFFRNIMDRIDSANFWETNNCRAKTSGSRLTIPDRLPDYGNMKRLADRSIGFVLGPVAILYLHSGNIESMEIKSLVAFFENYIIARQLNDDAHDWEEDIKAGRLSPAVTSVLKKYAKQIGKKSVKEIDLNKEIGELQKIFWHEVIQDICGKTLFHIKKARKHLLDITAMENKAAFEGMLASVENSAREALAEQKEMLEFLKEYA